MIPDPKAYLAEITTRNMEFEAQNAELQARYKMLQAANIPERVRGIRLEYCINQLTAVKEKMMVANIEIKAAVKFLEEQKSKWN